MDPAGFGKSEKGPLPEFGAGLKGGVDVGIGPHLAARTQFLDKLEELLLKGCERWQRERRGWRSADELKPGKLPKPLNVAAFLKEECADASYRFLKDLRDGAADPEAIAVRTPVVFMHFLRRLEESLWFDQDDLNEIEAAFTNDYWPIEQGWLSARQREQDMAEFFQDHGGYTAVHKLLADPQAFHAWSEDLIASPYVQNKYQDAIRAGESVVLQASDLVRREFSDKDVPLALCALQDAAYSATLARMNCWQPETDLLVRALDQLALSRVQVEKAKGSERYLLGRFATNAQPLKLASARLQTDAPQQVTLLSIYDSFVSLRFLRRMREEAFEDGHTPISSVNITLILGEALKQRSKWLRDFGLFRKMTDVPGFVDQVRHLMAQAIAYSDRRALEETVMSEVIAFMLEPHRPLEQEWASIERNEASRGLWNDAAVALLTARAWMQLDHTSLREVLKWLETARKALEVSKNYLAWSDFYCVCDDFMVLRGNQTMRDYALNNVRKLHRVAGNAAATKYYEMSLSRLSCGKHMPRPVKKRTDDNDLHWFLREEPPPFTD